MSWVTESTFNKIKFGSESSLNIFFERVILVLLSLFSVDKRRLVFDIRKGAEPKLDKVIKTVFFIMII